MGIVNFLFKKRWRKELDAEIKKISQSIANIHISNYVNKIKARYNNYSDYSGQYSGAKWPYGLSASGSGFFLDHYTTRQNVRRDTQTDLVAKSIVDRAADTIADIGLMRECTPDVNILGITSESGEKWSENVDRRFHLWAKSKNQHREGQYNFYQSHRLYAKWMYRDNDIFPRLYYSARKDLISPLQFGFVEPNQIRGDTYTSSYYQNPDESDGIVKNPDGTEKAYKVWFIKNGKYESVTIPAIGARSKRVMMFHGYIPEYANQTRGFSLLSHAIQEFENVTDFSSSVIKKAIAQSSIALGVENDQLDPTNPFEGNISFTGAAGPIQDTGREFAQTTTGPILDYCTIPEATITTPGSVGVFNLQKGDHLKHYENKTPSDSYESFMNTFVSYLSASTGMSIEFLLMKFNRSYSASRAMLILAWRIATIMRGEMESDYLNIVFEMWLSEEIAIGRISAPGWQDPILRAAWLVGNWIGSPMPQIDPQRAAKANEINAGMGLTTLDREARQLNGSSGKANRAKLKKEYEELPPSPFKKGGV